MNGNPAPLRLERIRSFGKSFSDTRRFIRENFVIFFKTILFLAGPFYLLTCTLNIFYQVRFLNPQNTLQFDRIGSYLAATTIISQARWIINGLITALVVSHFVKVYHEKDGKPFDVSDVSRSIFRDFGGSLLTLLLVAFAIALIFAIVGFFIYGLINVSLGAVMLLILTGWLAYFLVRFPVWYFIFSVFLARTVPGQSNVFSAIGYSSKLLSGNWWNTWILFFCMWLMLGLVGFALSMPEQIVVIMGQLSALGIDKDSASWKLFMSILLSLEEFAKTAVNSVFCITVALHFYSLKERADGEGTRRMVETIGSNPDDEEFELTY